ncbi:ATP-binding protein [Amycolatopsis sp. NPDC005232]|uniref:ATP-binding protein n=1 Tax=Amycolatopsis sp. NPDC005232 TaxID=3157027 RepID=UPI0033B8697A
MTTNQPRRLADTLAEWEAEQRAEWEKAGTALTFDAWKQEQRAKEAAEAEARIAAEERAAASRRVRTQFERQVPHRYLGASTDQAELLTWSATLAGAVLDRGYLRGPSILLVGRTGVGKTHAAYGALSRYIDAGGHCRPTVVTAADLYAQLRPRPGRDSEELFEQHARANLLFVDDLGAAKSSEWVEEINYRLINARYNNNLPTLITSNVPPTELGAILGDRVASRLTEMCTTVVLKGHDRRRAA